MPFLLSNKYRYVRTMIRRFCFINHFCLLCVSYNPLFFFSSIKKSFERMDDNKIRTHRDIQRTVFCWSSTRNGNSSGIRDRSRQSSLCKLFTTGWMLNEKWWVHIRHTNGSKCPSPRVWLLFASGGDNDCLFWTALPCLASRATVSDVHGLIYVLDSPESISYEWDVVTLYL